MLVVYELLMDLIAAATEDKELTRRLQDAGSCNKSLQLPAEKIPGSDGQYRCLGLMNDCFGAEWNPSLVSTAGNNPARRVRHAWCEGQLWANQSRMISDEQTTCYTSSF